MDYIKERLKERCLLFLYVLSSTSVGVNTNTFKRYLYLYYLSGSFFYEQMDDITISIDKGDIKIPYLDTILDEFSLGEYIEINDNEIQIDDELINLVNGMLSSQNGEKGKFYDLYREIKPFINLLNSYDDQFIFTIFFSEPTFQEASERGVDEVKSSSSILSKLLIEFKQKLSNQNIDDYDILTHWMDYVLKNYYK